MSDYILNKVIDDPHIAIHIQSYPDRLFGNIDVILNLFILKNRYLDAAHKGLVTGKDRDDYIETARRKAHDLKEYIDVLFDWFKLNSDEFALEIQSVEVAERQEIF